MNYKLITHSNNSKVNEVAASIKEVSTDNWVAVNLHLDFGRRLVNHLNQGGGFNGNTPDFFCKKIMQNEK